MIQGFDILDIEALAVGRIADEGATGGHNLYFVDVAAFELDVLVESCALDVGTGDSDGLALDVAAIDLVGELTLGTVVVVDVGEQFLVIVGPLLEGIVVTINARGDVGADEGSLDEECARAAHGVDQVGLAVPAAQQDDAGSEHLVDGCIGLPHTPAALEQRFAAAVERQGDLTSRDVDVEADVGIADADAGALAIFLVKEVGNGVLDTIGDKTGVVEILAIDGSVDGKSRFH